MCLARVVAAKIVSSLITTGSHGTLRRHIGTSYDPTSSRVYKDGRPYCEKRQNMTFTMMVNTKFLITEKMLPGHLQPAAIPFVLEPLDETWCQ
jgi:hypothetical protein